MLVACFDGNRNREYHSIRTVVLMEDIEYPVITSGYMTVCCSGLYDYIDTKREEEVFNMREISLDVSCLKLKWARISRAGEGKPMNWNLAAQDLDSLTLLTEAKNVATIKTLEVRSESECTDFDIRRRARDTVSAGVWKASNKGLREREEFKIVWPIVICGQVVMVAVSYTHLTLPTKRIV